MKTHGNKADIIFIIVQCMQFSDSALWKHLVSPLKPLHFPNRQKSTTHLPVWKYWFFIL